jgi:hypothetical protein
LLSIRRSSEKYLKKMVVLWKNELYQLEMPYRLFESWKLNSPQRVVEILQLTDSTYRQLKKAKVGDLQDWSVERNLQALGRN